MIIKETQLITADNGIQYYPFDAFHNQPVISFFTTRNGGVSAGCYDSLNFGLSSGDDVDLVKENYRRLAHCLQTDVNHLVLSAQTHTNHVLVVTGKDAGKGITRNRDYEDIDGLITNESNLGLVTAHADCTPVQFFDPVKRVIGAAHSGWMGTRKNISKNMVQTMISTYGSNPKDILVGIGPSLCQDCFEVDQDVADQFLDVNSEYIHFMYQKGIKTYIDLRKIIEQELLSEGIDANHIHCNPICTKCHPELFYSHRNMGVKRGVMASAIILKDEQ